MPIVSPQIIKTTLGQMPKHQPAITRAAPIIYDVSISLFENAKPGFLFGKSSRTQAQHPEKLIFLAIPINCDIRGHNWWSVKFTQDGAASPIEITEYGYFLVGEFWLNAADGHVLDGYRHHRITPYLEHSILLFYLLSMAANKWAPLCGAKWVFDKGMSYFEAAPQGYIEHLAFWRKGEA